MGTYSIRDLERISNTKAHTIRIWEQRYGLLTPNRSTSNVRYYDDEQLRKLLTVCTLLKGGMKISHIGQLSRHELSAALGKVMAGLAHEDVLTEAYINLCLHAIATFDVAAFLTTFDDILDKFGWEESYRKVVYPLLVRTGYLWIREDLLPSQEHFLSNLLRQKLFSAIDQLPRATSDQKWLLFLHEQEDHEIGLLFSCLLIRQHNHEAIYLGARVPYTDLADVIEAAQPTHIYTFFVASRAENYIGQLLSRIGEDFPHVQLMYSGSAEAIQSVNISTATHISSIDQLIHLLRPHEQ